MSKITHTDDYAKRRRQEYPSIEDQLEALWSLLPVSALITSPVYQQIQAIKTKYPKPDRNDQ